jgi:hypothetical protein
MLVDVDGIQHNMRTTNKTKNPFFHIEKGNKEKGLQQHKTFILGWRE